MKRELEAKEEQVAPLADARAQLSKLKVELEQTRHEAASERATAELEQMKRGGASDHALAEARAQVSSLKAELEHKKNEVASERSAAERARYEAASRIKGGEGAEALKAELERKKNEIVSERADADQLRHEVAVLAKVVEATEQQRREEAAARRAAEALADEALNRPTTTIVKSTAPRSPSPTFVEPTISSRGWRTKDSPDWNDPTDGSYEAWRVFRYSYETKGSPRKYSPTSTPSVLAPSSPYRRRRDGRALAQMGGSMNSSPVAFHNGYIPSSNGSASAGSGHASPHPPPVAYGPAVAWAPESPDDHQQLMNGDQWVARKGKLIAALHHRNE